MPNQKLIMTKQVKALNKSLQEKGISTELEYWDGHKHIDIAILSSKIYIEVDGLHHFTDPRQIEADFKRNHYSNGDDFDTIHIPNIIIDHYLNEVVEAILKVIKNRKK